ncbi:MAG: hypothetical protein ACREJM_11075 [Candidatus Saccharimonadales bacterium]
MHNRLLITLTPEPGADSEAVRHDAFNRLVADNSFCGDGGRFGSPLCDWFVIGGRWSGMLVSTLMGGAFERTVRARFPDMDAEFLPTSIVDKHAGDLDALWESLGGAAPCPYTRDSHEDFGYPDDAMRLTKELYTALLTEHAGEDTGDGYADLDGDPLSPDFVGRKWLVVVDYHS